MNEIATAIMGLAWAYIAMEERRRGNAGQAFIALFLFFITYLLVINH